MISTVEELKEALAHLTVTGGDNQRIEAKTFSEFSSNSIGPSISAFANLPGGGTLLLGVDERLDNPVVGVKDPQLLAQQVTNLARKMSTPVSVDVHVLQFSNVQIVSVNVSEASVNSKPIKYNNTAYVRQYDGDYAISLQEEQQLLRRHHRPRDDREPVPGTSLADLDEAAVKAFANSVRRTTPTLASASDEEILIRLNATTPSGEATVAGLYALGIYPQQFLPHHSLTAAVIDPKDLSSRGTNRIDFTGPLPTILVECTGFFGPIDLSV